MIIEDAKGRSQSEGYTEEKKRTFRWLNHYFQKDWMMRGRRERGWLLLIGIWIYRGVPLDSYRRLCQNGKTGSVRVTVHMLKYSSMTSSREAKRIGRFQYPGDSNKPSNRVSCRISSRISKRDLVGVVGVVDRVNALYFCFASTYLYKKSRSIQATANAVVSHVARDHTFCS